MSFRQRLRAGDLLAGTWIKTPHPHVVEVLAHGPLDCLVLDAEHAPFDRAALDLCLLAGRGGAAAMLVRPPTADAHHILNALDCGADGVVAPHIRTAAQARALVAACRHGPGGRGYAGSTRAAGYGTADMATHRQSGERLAAIAQIEDVDALDAIDAIAAVPGLDALFIGRADLTISMDAASPDGAAVAAAVADIVAAGRRAGIATGMFLPRSSDVAHWRHAGASLFVLESDHHFLRAGSSALAAAIRG